MNRLEFWRYAGRKRCKAFYCAERFGGECGHDERRSGRAAANANTGACPGINLDETCDTRMGNHVDTHFSRCLRMR